MAPSEMTVPAERLDKEFFALAESEGVTDVEELNKVLDRAVGLRTFLTARGIISGVSTGSATTSNTVSAASMTAGGKARASASGPPAMPIGVALTTSGADSPSAVAAQEKP